MPGLGKHDTNRRINFVAPARARKDGGHQHEHTGVPVPALSRKIPCYVPRRGALVTAAPARACQPDSGGGRAEARARGARGRSIRSDDASRLTATFSTPHGQSLAARSSAARGT